MIYKQDIQAVFGMQRYFRTFAANPSDSISDVVIQMHFLSLYKGRICVYSTRTKSGKNSYTNSYTKVRNLPGENFKISRFLVKNHDSYTNSYTNSYTRILGVEKILKIFQIGLRSTCIGDFLTRKNRNRSTSIAVCLWCHRESNQGHKEYQSFALPTELWHQFFLQNCPIFRLGLQR